MYCKNCGKVIPNNSSFCMYCGTKITDVNECAEISWPLLVFVKAHGQPRYVPDFKDRQGNLFAALSFDAKSFEINDVRDIVDKNGIERKSGFVMVTFSPILSDIADIEFITENCRELQVARIPPVNGSCFPSFKLRPSKKLLEIIESSANNSQESNIEHIEDFVLPSGGIYTGEAIVNYGMVDITGKGSVTNIDGSKYVGMWSNGHPSGFGTYIFKDGDFHRGFFEDTPNGVGYMCLNTQQSMKIGIFRNGKMTGWAIGILPNGSFNCSFLDNGRIVQNHTEDFSWMEWLLQTKVFTAYTGNMVQCSEKDKYIRFGAPNRTDKNGPIEFDRSAIGFTLTNEGTMYVGMVKDINNLNGKLVKCTSNHKIICGTWKNNVLVNEESMEEVDAYTNIQLTFEKNNQKSDLPF